jgi:hypothetical protein
VEQGKRIEELEEPAAKERQRQSTGRPKKGSTGPVLPLPKQDPSGRATTRAAKGVGQKKTRYLMAKAVVDAGEQDTDHGDG